MRDQPHNKLHLTARHSRFGGSFKRQSEVRGAADAHGHLVIRSRCLPRNHRSCLLPQTGETAVLTKSVTVIRDGNHDAGKKLRAKIVLKKNAMEVRAQPQACVCGA